MCKEDEKLCWKDITSEPILPTPVLTVREKQCVSKAGMQKKYYVFDAPDWAILLAVRGENLLLVRQWRHGTAGLTVELPGGTVEAGEDPAKAAARELEEEVAYTAGKLVKLGTVNPNPALFNNRFHVFLAENLTPLPGQHLDDDEQIDIIEEPIADVVQKFGTGEYIHAFMGTALALYLRYLLQNGKPLPGAEKESKK